MGVVMEIENVGLEKRTYKRYPTKHEKQLSNLVKGLNAISREMRKGPKGQIVWHMKINELLKSYKVYDDGRKAK